MYSTRMSVDHRKCECTCGKAIAECDGDGRLWVRCRGCGRVWQIGQVAVRQRRVNKVLPGNGIAAWANELRELGKRIVATCGCFDLLHAGHVGYLERAAGLGDALIVGLNSDESVCKLKGAGRPIHKQQARALMLAALECVDAVAVFEEINALSFIGLVRPHVWTKGGDYTAATINQDEADLVRSLGGNVEVLAGAESASTTELIEQVRQMGSPK